MSTIVGTSGNDSLVGTDNDDTLDGAGGQDTLAGGKGNDIYVIGASDTGSTIIEQAGEGHDTLVITAPMRITLPSNVEDLDMRQAGGATTGFGNDLDNVIYLTGSASANGQGGNDTYRIEGSKWNVSILTWGGSYWPDDQGTNTISFGPGITRESLSFSSNPLNNYVMSSVNYGSVTDLLIKQAGTDNAVTVQHFFDLNQQGGNAFDGIHFDDGSFMSAAEIGALMNLKTNGDDSWTGTAGNDIIYGLAGKDTLNGSEGNDTINGGLGDDYFVGGAGNDVLGDYQLYSRYEHIGSYNLVQFEYMPGGSDTYHFDKGFGSDVIIDSGAAAPGMAVGSYTETDTIEFGDGISADDVYVTSEGRTATLDGGVEVSGTAAVFHVAGTTDQVAVFKPDSSYVYADGSQYGGNFDIEQVRFANGTTWNWQSIQDHTRQNLIGTDYDDTLTGGAANDTLTGNGGNDTLNGGGGDDRYVGGSGSDLMTDTGGNDTYVFDGGFGSDQIIDKGANSSADKIVFGQGISASDIVVTRGTATVNGVANGTQTTFKLKSTGDQVGVFVAPQDKAADGDFSIESVQFADGTNWDKAAVTAHITKGVTLTGTSAKNTLTGGYGNDTLDGQGGNDTLSGGWGDDLLIGGKGSDTYLFGRGDGNDTIVDNDSTWFVYDTLKVSNANSHQLWLQHSGNDLLVSVIGTSDSVRIQDWYLGSAHHVESIVASDGKTLSSARVNALVTAMSAFSPPAAGQTTLLADTEAALSKSLASAWR